MKNPLRRKANQPALATSTPEQLLGDIREAQAVHAQTIGTANARLIDDHTAIYAKVKSRQEVIAQQIALLDAEANGLARVAVEANPATLDYVSDLPTGSMSVKSTE